MKKTFSWIYSTHKMARLKHYFVQQNLRIMMTMIIVCDMCASTSFICVKTDVGMWSHDDKNDDDVLCI